MRLVILNPCQETWEAMRGDGLTRHCSVCDKRVHDLSARTEAQAMGLLALGAEGLCVRFEMNEAGAVRHAPRGPRRTALAAGIVAAAVATGCRPSPPPAVAPTPSPAISTAPVNFVPVPTTSTAACSPGSVPGDAGACEELEQKQVGVITMGNVVILPTARFAYGSSKVLPESRTLLDAVAQVLREHPEITKVAVVGHTSPDEKAGARLGEARAGAIIAALAERQVERGRLVAEGHASEQPFADNATKEGREKNRRVLFRILERNACPVPTP